MLRDTTTTGALLTAANRERPWRVVSQAYYLFLCQTLVQGEKRRRVINRGAGVGDFTGDLPHLLLSRFHVRIRRLMPDVGIIPIEWLCTRILPETCPGRQFFAVNLITFLLDNDIYWDPFESFHGFHMIIYPNLYSGLEPCNERLPYSRAIANLSCEVHAVQNPYTLF